MSLKYFGTDGIRGNYGSDPITESFAQKMALGLVSFLHTEITDPEKKVSVVIGRDTRFSGKSLTQAFSEVFEQKGIRVLDIGVMPTPQIAFAVNHFEATLGLAITASHNPVSDNGFKLFNADGTKFSPKTESLIESHIDGPVNTKPFLTIERASRTPKDLGTELTLAYFEKLRSHFNALDLKGKRIVVDTANGATYKTTPSLLESLGAKIICIANQPNGQNINAQVGSEYPDPLVQKVIETSCDFGIAHDGDGDRVILVDSNGEVLSGEHFLAIIARYSPSIGCSKTRPLVTTTMSNFALNSYLQEAGIETLRTDVGDRNVAYKMFEHKCGFGGENSGHYICSDVLRTGDGLVAVLKLLEAIQATGKSLADLKSEMRLYPSELLNLRVKAKLPLESLKTLQSAISSAESQTEGQGRVLLRYSGTENKLRILVECASATILNKVLAELNAAVLSDLEVL